MRYSDWSRYDESGVPQTCPLINEVIAIVDCSNLDESKREIITLMEKLRDHNEKLRQWGSETNYALSEAYDEIKELEYKISQLQET